jgi:hypothetical protein
MIQPGIVVECEGVRWVVLKVLDDWSQPYAQVVRHGDPGADECSYITLERIAHSLAPFAEVESNEA